MKKSERKIPRFIYKRHDSDGRLRLRMTWLHDEPDEATRIADALAAEPGVREVRVRAYTGSVLLLYDRAATDGERLARAACRVAGVEHVTVPGRETKEELAEMMRGAHEQGSELARAGAEFLKGLDFDVLRASGGRVSLGTLVSLTLLGAAGMRLATADRLQLPEWHQLLWWSLRSFIVAEGDVLEKAAPPHTPLERLIEESR